MLRYRLPDGRSWKRLWEGWVGSFMMLLVLLEHRARKMSRMDGRYIYVCVYNVYNIMYIMTLFKLYLHYFLLTFKLQIKHCS